MDADALRRRLTADDPAERVAAATAVGDAVVLDLAEELRAAVADPDPAVRRAAARGLGVLHAFCGAAEDPEVEEAVAALVEALADAETPVRVMATAALDLMQAPAAARALVPLLQDPECAEIAEEALVNLGARALPAAGALELVVRQAGEGADAALAVLRELGPGGLPVLGRLLDGPTSARVLDALPPLGPWAAPLLPQVAAHALGCGEAAMLAAGVLAAIGETAGEAAQAVLERGEDAVRVALLRALDPPGSATVGWAVRALFDPEAAVRREALAALSRAPALAAGFAGEIGLLAQDPHPEVAAAAAALLAGLGSKPDRAR